MRCTDHLEKTFNEDEWLQGYKRYVASRFGWNGSCCWPLQTHFRMSKVMVLLKVIG